MPMKTSPRFSPSVLSRLLKLAKCSNPCSMFSFISTAKASFIHASNPPTFSLPPINSSFPATLSSPSANPANHRARMPLTPPLKPRLLRSPRPPPSPPPPNPFLLYLSRSPRFRLPPRQSCQCQSRRGLRQDRKRSHHVC